MKKFQILSITIFTILFFSSCEKDEIIPIDIFETEELTAPTGLATNGMSGANTLYVNSDRIIETSDGYHIKGTIFSESAYEIFPVSSGDFIIESMSGTSLGAKSGGLSEIKSSSGSLDLSGYGTASFPSVGFLSGFSTDVVSGSDIDYNKGSVFSLENDFSNLPMGDETYYFHYIIDQTTESTSKGKDQKIKKTKFTFKDYFLDANDPAIFFLGDIATNGKSLVKNLGIGLSAGSSFTFTPFTYSESLEQAVGGTGFTSFNSPLYIGGEIPIRKYPLKIVGSAFINTSFSSAGPDDFFENGFDNASFQMGVNGSLTFDKSLIGFLPLNLDVSLGKSTLEVEYIDNEATIRFAGEYSQMDYMTEILGPETVKYIPVNASEGKMYASIGTSLDDYKLYIETSLSVNIPGMGLQPLSGAVVYITPEGIELSGKIDLPFEIGEVEVIGQVNKDGSFLLKGTAQSGIRFNDDLRYDANLSVEISNNGVLVGGDLFLPYGIGAAQFTGEISERGIGLSGSFASDIQFSPNVKLAGGMSFTASSWEGIMMEGNLNLPAGIADVEVHGQINAQGLGFGGTFSSEIDFGNGVTLPAINMSIEASTWDGVSISGGVNLPYELGYVFVYGGLTSDYDLYIGGKMGANLSIPGVSIFSCDLDLSASTISGVNMTGQVTLPGGIGNINMGGSISSSGFSLYGETTTDIDFIIVSLNTTFKATITQTSVGLNASGRGCITIPIPIPPWTEELCETVGVGIVPDWGNGSFQLSIDFPVVGSQTIGF